MNELSLLTSADSKGSKLYVDSVFSAYTYTGNGSTQTINNGIDLAGKGGMVWIKGRTPAYSHYLADTTRGPTKPLFSNLTSAEQTYTNSVTGFNSNGFTMGSDGSGLVNYAGGYNYVSWAFAKAPKFFDIVAYTGNNVNGRVLSHSLTIAAGFIIVKRTDVASTWQTWSKDVPTTPYGNLNSTAAFTGTAGQAQGFVYPSGATQFVVQSNTNGQLADVNATGGTYVAYLFAHDTSADGIIQCGVWTEGTGVAINLGWEPQFILSKNASNSTDNGSWGIADIGRGYTANTSGNTQALYANTPAQETTSTGYTRVTSTGFTTNNNASAGDQMIYLAIRRPNKPPTTGTQVYNAIARTGTGSAATVTGVGFAPDLGISKCRSHAFTSSFVDRLRGVNMQLFSSNTTSESTYTDEVTAFNMDGVTVGDGATEGTWNLSSSQAYINHFFKRAPRVFDVVCYTGTGVATAFSHGLGVLPEFIIWKSRSTTNRWDVWHKDLGVYASDSHRGLVLNTTAAVTSSGVVATSRLSSTAWTAPAGGETNTTGVKQVMYLFATLAGVSKVFSYTGNGSSQTINCGFATGARFVLIKRTDATGDWYIWDTVRGLVAGDDPHLSLNSTSAEVTTDDSIDPDSSGFIVNQLSATNINVTSATYIGLAFA